MQLEKIRPNHATVGAVLRACGYVGLVDEGMHCFDQMTNHYKLEPQIEHYSLAAPIASMKIWGLFIVCHLRLMTFYGEQSSMFGRSKEMWSWLKWQQLRFCTGILRIRLLFFSSNMYTEAERCGDVLKVRKIMKQSRLKKQPSCRWIEVTSEMHTSLA